MVPGGDRGWGIGDRGWPRGDARRLRHASLSPIPSRPVQCRASFSPDRHMLRILEEALTFDDVLLVPAYSEVLPHEVSLATQLTRGIRLSLPIVSAAMDTVTEHRLAIAIAQEGGIGIVHKNMTLEAQAREVARV